MPDGGAPAPPFAFSAWPEPGRPACQRKHPGRVSANKEIARHRGARLVDKAFDWIARVIELVLALAFILAVLLNFTNVVGRYLFGISLLGSDELQVFIIVGVTFLGAAVVTRRNQHLRMDVLVQFMPGPLRLALRAIEQLLLIVLAGFVISQSFFYARQMLRIGRTSDMAGVPMWIPHGSVALGFALILIVTLWRLAGLARRTQQATASDKAAS
jgi:TRAP-type C4-dicarboxylate transport system permease small subunit